MDLEQRRLQLHEILVGILGNENVYFQPPANLVMQYPCIRYERMSVGTQQTTSTTTCSTCTSRKEVTA